MQLKVKRLTDTAVLPVKAHQSDAGLDICADEERNIYNGQTACVSTGIAIAIPEGYYGRLKGRSGLTSKTALRVQEGTIDSDYRGEIKVICDVRDTMLSDDVWSDECYLEITKGAKIAQLIIQPLPTVEVEEVDELDDTDRGEGGFGSTGV